MIIAILVFAFYTKTNAQQGGKERMKAFKTAYITEELDLTVKEARKIAKVIQALAQDAEGNANEY